MITEHDHGVAASSRKPQHLERLRAAIHQVADKPEPVAIRGEANRAAAPELLTAALDIADRPAAMRGRSITPCGIASRRNARIGCIEARPSSAII